jgi:CheY-like chemotaxis protein
LILLADDDEDDRLLTRDALAESRLAHRIRFVADGQELMDYLHRRSSYADPAVAPRPGLILLDLNMPRKSGRAALREIKVDPGLRQIPVVVLTASKAREDVDRSYDQGANSYLTKPASFGGLVAALRDLGRYWCELVQLPVEGRRP